MLARRVSDERGIETLEWILVGALITGVAVVVYPGTLLPNLLAAVNAIAALLNGS
jgi:hypothetical protein